MGSQHPTSSDGGDAKQPQAQRRRRSPSRAERERRAAWGREWGPRIRDEATPTRDEGK